MREVVLNGQFYRILVDSVNKIWARLSYWTKASDVQFEDGSYLQDKTFGHCILARNKYYEIGDIAYCTNAPSWVRLSCVTAGTTANQEPSDYKTIQMAGVKITDGSAEFKSIDLRPIQHANNSFALMPSVSALNKITKQLGDVDNQPKKGQIKTANINVYVGDDGKMRFSDGLGKEHVLDYKTHDGTYTYSVDSVGETVNLGALHKIRYIDPKNVYLKGVQDGLVSNADNIAQIDYVYHHHTIDSTDKNNDQKTDCPYADNFHAPNSGGCFTTKNAVYCTGKRILCGNRYGAAWPGKDADVWVMCDVCGTIYGAAHSSEANYQSLIDMEGTACGKAISYYYTRSCGKTNGQVVEETITYK